MRLRGTFKLLFFRFLLVVIVASIADHAFTQDFIPGVSIYDETGYVEYIPGNLPFVISVPHGGDLEPSGISDRDCDTYVCSKDLYTQELGRSLAEAFFEQTGCYPHLIINLLHRKKFDANRDIGEAADGNSTVEQSWQGYHTFIDSAKMKIIRDHERGLFIDLHGHGHNIQRIELGYRISKTELQKTDIELNTETYINKSSIQTLVNDNLQSYTHAELLRGDYSFGTLLEEENVPAVPSANDPFPSGNEGYFSGGYNTFIHGSVNGGNIDGIQIECHQSIRFDNNKREKFADDLAAVINTYINIHYNDQYIDNYCNPISNLSENKIQSDISIYPNPASDYFYIESDLKNIEVSIYNSLGQKLKAAYWTGNPIDISFLINGYYILQLSKEAANLGSRKLIKY
jgi:N-formylglutamate amidohydrolase